MDSGEIVIKDIFPNLIKLKINNGRQIKISYNLLKRIQILSLINSKIKIDKNKEIELLSLKSLKIVEDRELSDKYKFLCPNLEYLFILFRNEAKINKSDISKNFKNLLGGDLNKIHLIYSKLMYCNIIYTYPNTTLHIGKGLTRHYYNEITFRRYGKDLFKYETHEYSNRPHFHKSTNDLYIKKFYCSKSDEYKKDFPENIEEIYEDGYENRLFKMIKKGDNLKYLQFIGIFINGKNVGEINVLIENLKYFLFLKGFCLMAVDKSIITKKDLLDIINNLSKLSLIENIKIEVANIDLNESEEKNILACIEGIKINKIEKKTIIELNSEIFGIKINKIEKKTLKELSSELFGSDGSSQDECLCLRRMSIFDRIPSKLRKNKL